ncbi:hypothetical protein [Streptomyces sp. NPDC088794]|jgi:hypothetical protein|uniref:hypothetical protein n=1 Tax=Streptomyces sp. NPDC088794 TaxID=3365902 RepID=UPI00381B2B5C
MALRRLTSLLASTVMVAAVTVGLTGTAQASASAGCVPRSGGKVNCNVWKTANTWECTTTDQTDSCDGTPAGILHAGTNYFYCEIWATKYTYGSYYNHYWALTDDDSGNKLVWLPVVYISGGNNDGPIPGLPTCA